MVALNLLAQDAGTALKVVLTEDSSEHRETNITADRYEQILRSRPQLGTAFDKFYEFQVRRGTLDQFSEQLKSEIEQRSDAKLMLLLGLIQLQRGLQSEALASLEQAERRLPADPFAAFYFAKALKDARRFDEALAAWQRALDRKPSQTLVLEILKETRLTARRTTNIEGIKSIWSSIERLYPSNLQILKLLAESMVEHQLPQAAKQIYEKLIQQTKEPAARLELQMQLAVVKAELGDNNAAVSDLRRLLNQVNPESWLHDSLLNKIESLFTVAKDSDGLTDFYTTRVAEKPDNIALVLRFAKHLAARERKIDAKQWIMNACKLAPTQSEPWEALAQLHASSGEFLEAAQTMQKLVELEPANADYIVKWGEYISLNSNADLETRQTQAGNVWQKLLEGHEKDPATLVRVAELLHKVSMTDAALKLYRQAVSIAPAERQSEYAESLADYLIRLNRRDEALVELQRIAIGSNADSGVLFRLSDLLQSFGFQVEALETRLRACELQPTGDQLLKLAEQLIAAKRYDEANIRLESAASLTSDMKELSVIWDALVRNQTVLGGLAERIDQLQLKLVSASQLQSDPKANVEQWQRLALMQEARRDFTAAAASAAKCTELNPKSIPAWLLAVRIDSRAGFRGREIHSLRQLCKLDPKNQNFYLQSLARTQLDLHQIEDALVTSEKCLQLVSATPTDYQQYAKICFDAKLSERAIESLRKCIQRFPQDRQSSMALANELMKLSNFDEAEERLWRTLELSRTEIEVREVLSALRSLFSSNNESRAGIRPHKASLLELLEAFGREHGRDSEVAIWACWLAKDINGHAEALRLVDRALASSYANLDLLQAALQVAESSDNRLAKKDYLQRLNQLSTAPIYQLQLGTVMAEQGDLVAAESYWRPIAENVAYTTELFGYTRGLIDSRSTAQAAQLVQVALVPSPTNWELLVLGIIAHQLNHNAEAAQTLADRLLAIDLPNTTSSALLTNQASTHTIPLNTSQEQVVINSIAFDRLAWLERAAPWQVIFNQADTSESAYRSNLGNPNTANSSLTRLQALQRGATIRTSPNLDIRINTFADARAIAVLAKLGQVNRSQAHAKDSMLDAPVLDYLDQASEEKSIDKLWDCILVMRPVVSRSGVYSSSGAISVREPHLPGVYFRAVELLADFGDHDALELAMAELVSRRHLQIVTARKYSRPPPPLPIAELQQLTRLVDLSYEHGLEPTLLSCALLSAELRAVGKTVVGEQLLQKSLAAATGSSKVANIGQEFLHINLTIAQEITLRAFQLELASNSVDANVAKGLIVIYDHARREPNSLANFGKFVDDLIRAQAKHLRSVPASAFAFDRKSVLPYTSMQSATEFSATSVTFPLPSPFVSNSLLTLLRYIRINGNQDVWQVVSGWLTPPPVNASSSSDTDSAAERAELVVRMICGCYWQWWLEDSQAAIALLRRAKTQTDAVQLLELSEAHMLTRTSSTADAFTILEMLQAKNDWQRRERELILLEAARASSDTEQMRATARRLAALPLDNLPDILVAEIMKATNESAQTP